MKQVKEKKDFRKISKEHTVGLVVGFWDYFRTWVEIEKIKRKFLYIFVFSSVVGGAARCPIIAIKYDFMASCLYLSERIFMR